MKMIITGVGGPLWTNEGYSEGVKSKWVKQASGQSGDNIVPTLVVCVHACACVTKVINKCQSMTRKDLIFLELGYYKRK